MQDEQNGSVIPDEEPFRRGSRGSRGTPARARRTSASAAPNGMPLVMPSESGLGAEMDRTASPSSIRPQAKPHGRQPGPWPRPGQNRIIGSAKGRGKGTHSQVLK